jgi:hypothetical protein
LTGWGRPHAPFRIGPYFFWRSIADPNAGGGLAVEIEDSPRNDRLGGLLRLRRRRLAGKGRHQHEDERRTA